MLDENAKKIDLIETINWGESMWPLTPDFLRALPLELIPDRDSLSKVKYPWELLDIIRATIIQGVKDIRLGENVQIKHSHLVVIDGPVWIGNNVKIFPHSTISGPVYIRDNVLIGNNSIIREGSFVGENCEIGFGSEIVRSIVGPGSLIHDSYVGDSILDKGVALGGGTKIANLRSDARTVRSMVAGVLKETQRKKLGTIMGQYTATGANSVILPGVKVGSFGIVGAGVILDRDLPDNYLIKLKQDIVRMER